MRRILTILAATALFAVPALAADKQPAKADGKTTAAKAPDGYKKVSELVPMPEFVPGMGVLYVQPNTLPEGPFLGYDREGKLANTTYMIPVKDFEARKTIEDLQAGTKTPVDHVDVAFNEGHPGVAEPHWHIVLWHIPKQQEARLQE